MNRLTIKARPNYSKRTFTIRRYAGPTVYAKYRTKKMEWRDFSDCFHNKAEDWEKFLLENEVEEI